MKEFRNKTWEKEGELKEEIRAFQSENQHENLPNDAAELIFNIIKAFSFYQPSFEYSVDFISLSSFLLLHFDEEGVFWILTWLVKKYSLNGLTLLSKNSELIEIYISVLNHLTSIKFPVLFEHLQMINISLGSSVGSWLSSLFTHKFSSDATNTIWDVLFLEDKEYLIKFLLAFYQIYQDNITQITNQDELVNFLSCVPDTIDCSQLLSVAEQIDIPHEILHDFPKKN